MELKDIEKYIKEGIEGGLKPRHKIDEVEVTVQTSEEQNSYHFIIEIDVEQLNDTWFMSHFAEFEVLDNPSADRTTLLDSIVHMIVERFEMSLYVRGRIGKPTWKAGLN